MLGIVDYYSSHQDNFQPYAGPGNWNDPDMVRLMAIAVGPVNVDT